MTLTFRGSSIIHLDRTNGSPRSFASFMPKANCRFSPLISSYIHLKIKNTQRNSLTIMKILSSFSLYDHCLRTCTCHCNDTPLWSCSYWSLAHGSSPNDLVVNWHWIVYSLFQGTVKLINMIMYLFVFIIINTFLQTLKLHFDLKTVS